MKRLIDKYLLDWKQAGGHKPLLIRGARQVGKTYAVRELGKKFSHFIEINFDSNPADARFFEKDLDPERIARDLSIAFSKPIIPGQTLLFFDEIQQAPLVFKSLRYFYERMPDLHVVAAGSLLDFMIEQIGMPVGRLSLFYMYPMSFIEFLEARKQHGLAKAIVYQEPFEPLSEIIHEQVLSYLGEYIAIGGMPEAVKCWVEKQDYAQCFQIQQELVSTYRHDFENYGKKRQIKYLQILFDYIPERLGKKFKYSEIGGYQKRELEPSLDLLVKAGVVTKVTYSAGNGIPLGAQADMQNFKLLFLDVALGQVVLGLNTGPWITDPLEQFVNKGELVEAFIGQELQAYSNPISKTSLYYWQRTVRGSEAEVDYLIQIEEHVIPIEVKGGAGTTLKSMHSFLESHPKSPYGIRFSTRNYSIYNKIHSYPLYAVAHALDHLKKNS